MCDNFLHLKMVWDQWGAMGLLGISITTVDPLQDNTELKRVDFGGRDRDRYHMFGAFGSDGLQSGGKNPTHLLLLFLEIMW